MELKKTPKADVYNQSTLYMVLGIVITLLLTITAFQWRFYDDYKAADLQALQMQFEEVLDIPITNMAPPPPMAQTVVVQQQAEVIEVPDEKKIEKEVEKTFDIEAQPVADTGPVNPNPGPVSDAPPAENPDEIFQIVEQQPYFEGGLEGFYKYIQKNLTYPRQAQRNNTQGKVFVQFVVDRDGRISDIKVLKGIGDGCDEEAVRVLKACPAWNPGKQRGKPVKVRMSLPITFKLSS